MGINQVLNFWTVEQTLLDDIMTWRDDTKNYNNASEGRKTYITHNFISYRHSFNQQNMMVLAVVVFVVYMLLDQDTHQYKWEN